jgi:transposase InsO family protein
LRDDRPCGADDVANALYVGERLRKLRFLRTDDSQVGLLSKWGGKLSKKGTGLAQLLAAHQHSCSCYIVNWDVRESMTEADIEIILQGAKEKYPEARLRIISDNGPHGTLHSPKIGCDLSRKQFQGRSRTCPVWPGNRRS